VAVRRLFRHGSGAVGHLRYSIPVTGSGGRDEANAGPERIHKALFVREGWAPLLWELTRDADPPLKPFEMPSEDLGALLVNLTRLYNPGRGGRTLVECSRVLLQVKAYLDQKEAPRPDGVPYLTDLTVL